MNTTTITAKKAVIKKTVLIACSLISDEKAGRLEAIGRFGMFFVNCTISTSVKKFLLILFVIIVQLRGT
jgi:hypothetical protein